MVSCVHQHAEQFLSDLGVFQSEGAFFVSMQGFKRLQNSSSECFAEVKSARDSFRTPFEENNSTAI